MAKNLRRFVILFIFATETIWSFADSYYAINYDVKGFIQFYLHIDSMYRVFIGTAA